MIAPPPILRPKPPEHLQDGLPEALTGAEDALARLDERLATSPIRAGWIARTHHFDACASLWLEGELVPLEDLVLRDAAADIRTPTHALARAQAILRARRRICAAAPGWAVNPVACNALLGRSSDLPPDPVPTTPVDPIGQEEAALDAELAAIDALIARTRHPLGRTATTANAATIDATTAPRAHRFAAWQETLASTAHLPPVLAAAHALLAWQDERPFDNADWLGRLLAADLLRSRHKTRAHLATINIGLKGVARHQRRARAPAVRLNAVVQGIALAAETGLRDHDRWLAARCAMATKLRGRRSTSHLPRLIEVVMERPMITTAMVARELAIAPRSAQDLIAELGLRELTGRSRYRAWGIL